MNPKSRRSSLKRHSRVSLLHLLSWYACQTCEASSYLQHRVRRPFRLVEYQHVIDGKSKVPYLKFWIPSSRSTETYGEKCSEQNSSGSCGSLTTEFHYGEQHWIYEVQGPNNNRHPNIPTSGRRKNFFRRLFDQFVGADQESSIFGTNNTNVTTEVSNATFNETSIYTTTLDENVNETAQFQPLRIRAILAESTGNGDKLTEDERHALFHDMLSPALLSWSSSLRVDPVVGNLTVDVNQLLDGETCGPGIESGLPSITVPLVHLEQGIPDTDMIVYLSLSFVVPTNETNVTNATALEWSNGTDANDTFVPQEADLWTRSLYTQDTTNFDDAGEANFGEYEDQVETENDIFNGLEDALTSAKMVSSNGTSFLRCSGDYLAAASFCSTDQYDRPTAALLHICIDEHFFDANNLRRNILTLMHELGHALGFNSLSMAHFRRPDGSPYTPRVAGDVPMTTIECTGPKSERTFANVALPSEEILQFREVRGGVRVAELVTPSVVQVVRNQFDCQLLTGAELESGEGLPLSTTGDVHGCLGDHWERRLFSNDLMNPIIDDQAYSPRISTLTLAFFADSGWYQVDLSGAKVEAGWGRGAGCSFVNDTCIGKDGQVPPKNAPFFCNDIPTPEASSVASEVHGCTPDLSRKATCSMAQYALDLPFEYQYFHGTYGSDVGGRDALMDYCPVYSGFDNGLCASLETENYMRADEVERFGVRNSRCLVGNIYSRIRQTALCLPIACVIEDRSLRVKVDKTWHLCEYAGQELFGQYVTVECPDPRRICPTFYCPYDCLGTGGQCDYGSGKCLCEYPGIFLGNETVLDVCGIEQDDAPDKVLSGPFLRPGKEDQDDPALPHPDSPLSDYYVPTTRELAEDDDRLMENWALALVSVSGVVALSAVMFLWGRDKGVGGCIEWITSKFRAGEHTDADDVVVNRNKDKMIATVLVDMRIHHSRQLNESLADTDEQLTESDASRGAPSDSLSELSSRRSEAPSDVDTSLNEIPEEDLQEPQEFHQETQVIRRRRIVLEEG